MRARFLFLTLPALLLATPADTQCGGPFSAFVDGLEQEARAQGHDPARVARFFANVQQDPKTLAADRKQGVFQMPFTDFARRLISQQRLDTGLAKARAENAIFDRIEQTYGVPRGVLLAFWAFETDYGAFQGDFNTLNSLVTLAHDCRRPDLFRPQIFAALRLFEQGDFDPDRTTGAWAGEIGMVQMLPADIIKNGIDGDGDGHVRLKTSAPDALMSGGKMLAGLGWQAGQPWLQEVRMPATMDWAQTGLETTKTVSEWAAMGITARSGQFSGSGGSILMPQGHKGPAFIAYPNFRVYFEWNQSFTYVLTAAYFATRLEGAPVFDARAPEQGLDGAAMKRLQTKLQSRGYDVGKIDGILGSGTRAAVRAEQTRLGMVVDGWPTPELLGNL